jgi:hypothetical protein
MSRRWQKPKPKDEDKPKAVRFGEKELADVRITAWRAGYLVLTEGRYYRTVHKPDLNALQRGNLNAVAAVASSPRLFSTADGNELLRWIAEQRGRS